MRSFRLGSSILVLSLLLAGCSKLGIGAKPAGLRITTNSTATVTLDGKDMGNTPFESTAQKSGKSSIKVTPAQSGQPYEASLKLYPGYMTQVDWNFGDTQDESTGVSFEYEDARDSGKAEIQLTASPDNVPVIIDGKNLGFTPLLVDTLSEGDHSVILQAPGYLELTRTVKLVKGVRTIMTGKLAKEKAPAPTPDPVATAAATIATPSAKKATPTPTPKATAKPTASPVSSTSATKATPTPTPQTSAGKPTTTTKPYVEILTTPTGWLRVRESADASAKELTKLDSGSSVPYASASSSGWLKIKYDGTTTGWVSSDYAKLVQ